VTKDAAHQRFDHPLLLQVICQCVAEAMKVLARFPIAEAQLLPNASEPLRWRCCVAMCLVQGQLCEETLMTSISLRLDELKEPKRFQL